MSSTSACQHNSCHHDKEVLKEEIKALRCTNAQLQSELQVSNNEVTKLAQMAVCEKNRAEKEKKEKDEAIHRLCEVEKELAECKKHEKEAICGLEEALKKIVELEFRIGKQDVEIEALKLELKESRKKEECYKRDYEIAKKEEKKMEKELSDARDIIKELTGRLDEALKENECLRKAYQKRVSEVCLILNKPL